MSKQKPVLTIVLLFCLLAIKMVHAGVNVQTNLQRGNANETKVVSLTCEYLADPIGIDSPSPRLRWQLKDERDGAKQTGFRILVGTDSLLVAKGVGDNWDFTNTDSEAMLIKYAGKKLQPFAKYFWAVQVFDKDKKASKLSHLACFRTGMMQMKNWKGDWISDTRDASLKQAALFRKEFRTSKKIKSAQAYIAVGGLYELYLNGERVGNHQLDPAFTRFDRRNLYQAYDVTKLLAETNCVGVSLGNGWYNHQSTAVWFFHEAPWRARPKFCCDLKIFYLDGTTETISTGTDWRAGPGPIVSNNIYTAEHYNANFEQKGWNTVGFNDSKWQNSILTTAPSQNIVSQNIHPIRHTGKIIPVGFKKVNDKKYIYDLGCTIAGISKIFVSGTPNTVIRLAHAEFIDEKGEVDQSNIIRHYRPTDETDPFHTDIYTLKGEGKEVFYPRFNYKGFRYVEVTSNKAIELNKNSLVGIEMHSDVPKAGSIYSSNETLNKIWKAANSSYLANLYGYPTDCPQREKNGWTGDAHLAIETGLYNFDGITIYEKWLADHRDEQQPNGVLPAIIPSSGWGYQWANGPDWTSTIAIIPWNIYLFYGDSKLLQNSYDNIKLYVDHISDISEGNLTDWGLGDWCPYKSKSSKKFTSSIYYYTDVSILANAAKLFGKMKDYEKYSALAASIKNAINDEFFDKKTFLYCSGTQTELSAALHWKIVPDEYRQKVADNLAKRVIADNSHVDVGILGSKTLLNALADNGYPDLAYKVASQETFPSWGWWIVNGSTTFIENWKMGTSVKDNSQNHIMFGEISAWYYKALGGIKTDPENPGFKNILLEPHFVNGLEYFEAEYNGPFGKIESSWEKVDGKTEYSILVPANCTATLTLSAEKIRTKKQIQFKKFDGKQTAVLPAGRYEFNLEF